MSVKEMLTKLNNFSDNPYDAKYRPEKEMKILYAALLISLPILLGLCNGFFILAFGPLRLENVEIPSPCVGRRNSRICSCLYRRTHEGHRLAVRQSHFL